MNLHTTIRIDLVYGSGFTMFHVVDDDDIDID